MSVAAPILNQQELQAVEDGPDLWRYDIAARAMKITNGKWQPYRHCLYLADVLRRALMKGNARIIINMPPRHGKSELVSRHTPGWFLDWFPTGRVVLVSYGTTYAKEWGEKARDDYEYMGRWGVKKMHRGTADWQTEKGGGMISLGIGGSLTGRGFDLGILDDPHKNFQEAHSMQSVERLRNWLDGVFMQRAEPGASIIAVGTRWNTYDCTAYMLEKMEGEGWTHIQLPAIAETDDVLGREPGEALCPERYDEKALEHIRVNRGSMIWVGMYQNRPSPAGGNIIRRRWYKYYGRLPARFEYGLISCDLTFKKTEEGSYVVFQVWGKIGVTKYLIKQVRDRMSFTECKRRLLALYEEIQQYWPEIGMVLVEPAANGEAIMDELKEAIPGLVPFDLPAGRDAKRARLVAASPDVEAGNVWIPDPDECYWVEDFVAETTTAPQCQYWDQCDAFSQAMLKFRDMDAGVQVSRA